MAEQRISKRFVDGLRAADCEFTAWDMDLPGFGVRVRPNGSRSYIVVDRAGHGSKAPVRKLTLGPTTKLPPPRKEILRVKKSAPQRMVKILLQRDQFASRV